MRAPADRKLVIRIVGLTVSTAGLLVAAASLARFIGAVTRNAVDGGPALTRYPEYYRQIGAHYARGFTTGFFVCYFLMLVALIVGSWVDEASRARRAARATPAPVPPPPLGGEAPVPD